MLPKAMLALFLGAYFHGYLKQEVNKQFIDEQVELIIEGTTDLGYWNTSLGKVRQIGFGQE